LHALRFEAFENEGLVSNLTSSTQGKCFLEFLKELPKRLAAIDNALTKRHQWLKKKYGHVFQAIQTSQPQVQREIPRDRIGLILFNAETSWIGKTTESSWF
jgi:hypothetical protein